MLVFDRKVDTTIIIDGDIVIKVVKIRTNRVTIGIEAPDTVEVLRGELLEGDSGTRHRRGRRHN